MLVCILVYQVNNNTQNKRCLIRLWFLAYIEF